MIFTIPNIITVTNAFGGCLAIISILSGQVLWLPLIISYCFLADFSDGLLARALKQSSEIGKELDSLADVISFGVVPGTIFYYLINKTLGIESLNWNDINSWTGTLGFVVTMFSVFRLAKFNTDKRQSEHFIGLSTPANTIFVIGILLTIEYNFWGLGDYLLNLSFLIPTLLILSFLLIAEIPMFSFKFKKFSWKNNEYRFMFILVTLIFLVALPLGIALMLIIATYLISSLILSWTGILKI
jgi:CDP-diacylglycerol---serine O-phosphatidyltransferase